MLARSHITLNTGNTILSIRYAMWALGADTIVGVRLLLICKDEHLVSKTSAPLMDLTAPWIEGLA